MKNDTEDMIFAQIPMRSVGPIRLIGPEVDAEVMLPLATYESPLWPSVGRGARVATVSGGLTVVIRSDCMTRSLLVEAPSALEALRIIEDIERRRSEVKVIAEGSSRFAQFIGVDCEMLGGQIYVRLKMQSGDASGHNMLTNAAEHVMNWLLVEYPVLRYVSLSGNFCTDKKGSAVNGLLGRGKNATAECVIPRKICSRYLKTTPAKMAEINLKKNWMGTGLAGAVRTANAHFANMLLAFYLATGQDAANIVEGSQGFVYAEERQGDLYFGVNLPHLIVGTVGNGKELDFVQKNLEMSGCTGDEPAGVNARKLAACAAASVWCGELSLLAALTNPGELMATHKQWERKHE